MSRTYRKKNPKRRPWFYEFFRKHKKKTVVDDGTPSHPDGSCQNHGGCPWCEGNRLFNTKKRQEAADEFEQ